MGSGINSIGVSALQNAQLGLATTSHNIANANTEGYNRQRIIQVSNVATLTGSGYVGQGAHVSTIERIYSSHLAKQVYSAQTKVSELEAYTSNITQLNSLLMDSDAGLSSALNGFFTGVQQVSADPSSLTTRQTMVSAAQVLAVRFQSLDEQFDAQYQSINSQVQSDVASINSYSEQIASLNKQIITAQAATNQPPNDLYDQRDQLLSELNKLISVTTTTDSNGSFSVYFGNGQQLVVGTQVTSLSAVASSQDPSKLTVAIKNSSGTQELPESIVTGGSLGGVLRYRSETLDEAANELGRLAASVALTFNAQHALGQDLLGNIDDDTGFEADFFNIGAPSVVANTNNLTGADATPVDGEAIVTASFADPSYSDDGSFYTNLTGSDYQLDYDGATLTLTRLSDNEKWTGTTVADLNSAINPVPADPEVSQGFTIAATGTFQTGASYLIQPTRNVAQSVEVNATIASDVRQIAAAAPIRTSAGSSGVTNTGTATISAGSVVSGYSAPASGSPVTLTFAGGDFSSSPAYPITVTVDGVETDYAAGASIPYTSGATISLNGISFTISGQPADGDAFSIEKNTNGVSDNRNAALLGKLQTAKTMAGNTASYSTVYAQMVGDLGNKGSEAETILAAQTTLLTQAEDARDSVSGVNLDEEAAKLLEYQQAYQAAAKMLQISSELFDSILAIG